MCHGRVALGPRSDWLRHKTAWTSRGRRGKGDQSKPFLERPPSERLRDGCGWPVDVTGRPRDDFCHPMDVHRVRWTFTGRRSHYRRSSIAQFTHHSVRGGGKNTSTSGLGIFAPTLNLVVSYRNWYQYWGHCCLINDLGSSPQPEGEARGLWWASQVVNETTMTEIEVSISILSWWN